MTVKQFRKKVVIARKHGEADLGNGLTLRYTGTYWSIMTGKQTIDTAEVAANLEYLFQ